MLQIAQGIYNKKNKKEELKEMFNNCELKHKLESI